MNVLALSQVAAKFRCLSDIEEILSTRDKDPQLEALFNSYVKEVEVLIKSNNITFGDISKYNIDCDKLLKFNSRYTNLQRSKSCINSEAINLKSDLESKLIGSELESKRLSISLDTIELEIPITERSNLTCGIMNSLSPIQRAILTTATVNN